MARLPDLVRDSQLDVKLCDGHTIYVNFESSLSSRQRAILREETWKEGRQIGGGAFGSVWQEICIHGDRKGAVRAVKKISVRQEGLRDAVYMRELEAIAKFSHPKYERCFVKSFGWYESPGSLCITMEYCQLGDLQAYLSRVSPLPESQTQEITFQILEGVYYMHDNGFAHRDLKPGNILIMSQPPEPWWIKIADFGISKRVEESLGMPSTVKGTLQFMAPELLGLEAKPSTNYKSTSVNPYAADMWSLGEIAFQVLTKQPAFPQVSRLMLYVEGSQPFPNTVLVQYDVSSSGQHFILSSMLPAPDSRLTAAQAWNHDWMKQYKTSIRNKYPVTSASSYSPSTIEELDSNFDIRLSGSDDIVAVPKVDNITQQFATWSSILERGQEAQSSTEPFAMNQGHQGHNLPGSQALHSSAIDSGVRTVTATSNLEQPRTSILRRLVRKLHMENGYVLQQTFKGKEKVIGKVRAVGFSLDSKPMAVSWKDSDIMLWDLSPGSKSSLDVPLSLFKGDNYWARVIAISPDGKLLASSSRDGTVRLWHLGLGLGSEVPHMLKGYDHDDDDENKRVIAIVFSPDGKVVASGSESGYLRLWSTDSGALLRTLSSNFELPNGSISYGDCRRGNSVTRPVTSVAFPPDGNLVASGFHSDIELWDSGSDIGAPLRVFERPKDYDNSVNSRIHTIAFSPDGRLLASGLADGRIRLWDPNSGTLLRTAKGHSSDVSALAFSPDGKLASSSRDGTIKLWDLHSGLDLEEPMQTLKGFKNKDILHYDYSLAFSPDAKWLASGSEEAATVSLWGLWSN